MNTDLIDIPIIPQNNSIRIIRVDNQLFQKSKYFDGKWIDICRMDKCLELPLKKEVCCEKHLKAFLKTIQQDTIISKNGFRYKYIGTEWTQLCSFDDNCPYTAHGTGSKKLTVCFNHANGTKVITNIPLVLTNMYQQMKNEYLLKHKPS